MLEVISSFRNWITGVCSPYVVSLCDFAYDVVGYELAVALYLTLWLVCMLV